MDFNRVFEPATMAVAGVSLVNDRHPANVIYHKNRLRYPVKVYPINPRGGVLQGERVFKNITEIQEPVDLAVIAVRAEHVPETIAQCIESGVGGAAVISGGFAESGRSDLQDELRKMALAADFPLIGPNCLGLYRPSVVDSFFLPSERMVRPEAGNVAMVSQSGGVLVDQMVKFAMEGVGLSLAVSIGNKACVGEIEVLQYLIDDPKTEVIAYYVEGFGKGEGRRFVEAAAQSPKPVVILKAGKSPGGSRAVSSHTASLAGDYQVFSKVMAQFGIVEALTEFELVAFCEALGCYRDSIEGRLGIITGSGGHGALAVDLCSEMGLDVPQLPGKAKEKLAETLSESIKAIASLENPVDLTGSAVDDDFEEAAKALCLSPDIDCVLILLLPYLPGMTSDLGARLSNLYAKYKKPLVAYVPHVEKYGMMIEGFELNHVPVSFSIKGAVLMAEALRRCKPC
ncbi:MAG: CoA-binding protein [Desulfatiglandaceae bacterium]